MKRTFGYLILVAMLLIGCDRFMNNNSDDNTEPEEPKDTDTDTGGADTDTQTDDTNEVGIKNVPPIVAEGKALEEIARALEAKRVLLEQQERELLQREQMITHLEAEAMAKHQELTQLQKETQEGLDNAVVRIKDQYTTEHEKLVKHWEKIKAEHKEFITKYLNTDESGKPRDSLKPELARLKKEREQRIEQLIKTIEGMNPASCAMMITSMELDDAVEVMRGMSSTKSAEILGNMQPDKAAELARGLLGPKVPSVSDLEDIELPATPNATGEATENEKNERAE
ncbi:MAG: hypothetical protein JXX29_18650 [Deltaproteobacteria bacterium]|nr:hypothetical protein [Deltaproteobacteria bacterium]MBN2673706.1 hypothetical protein [Deltaproteobacteria bacterium]